MGHIQTQKPKPTKYFQSVFLERKTVARKKERVYNFELTETIKEHHIQLLQSLVNFITSPSLYGSFKIKYKMKNGRRNSNSFLEA